MPHSLSRASTKWSRAWGRRFELVSELGRYEDQYKLCYVRGPEGVIVELAEKIG